MFLNPHSHHIAACNIFNLSLTAPEKIRNDGHKKKNGDKSYEQDLPIFLSASYYKSSNNSLTFETFDSRSSSVEASAINLKYGLYLKG
jgi:hypothetical protein